jgi:rod shape-determining protein MreB
LVYVRGKGIVINEPSVVAVNVKTKQVLAIGDEAKKMVGKTPASIVATRPLVDGVVSDFEVTEQMLKYFINKVHKETYSVFPRPRVVVGIPSGVTEVEKRAVEDAATNAGARQTFLIEEPMAAAIGSRLPIQDAAGSMIVDIGGGTTEVAIGSAAGSVGGPKEVPMRGRDLVTGLPKEIMVTPEQIRHALAKSVREIVEAVKITIEETPPELVADIMERGIYLAGGGALLKGLNTMLARETKMPVHVAEDPLTAVARGTGLVLEDIDALKDILVPTQYGKIPR